MTGYSVTLNCFITPEILENLKKVKVRGAVEFDWRRTKLSHCTVKAVYFGPKRPSQKTLDQWCRAAGRVLARQKAFNMTVKGLGRFPRFIYAKVHSPELKRLHRKLWRVLPSSQPHFDNLNYTPHVTLAVLRDEKAPVVRSKRKFGSFKVEEVQLLAWKMSALSRAKAHHRFRLQ